MKDTEQMIVDAAILIFNEDLSAPLEKVAEQAQTTRRTLHRYFKDRNELMHKCRREIKKACSVAMRNAYNATSDPLVQLENMFYAGLECGTKHAFLNKLHTLHDHHHQHSDKECSDYDDTFEIWKSHLALLQQQNIISQNLSIEWVHHFYNGIVVATISSKTSGNVDWPNLRKSAWFSFSRGIGI